MCAVESPDRAASSNPPPTPSPLRKLQEGWGARWTSLGGDDDPVADRAVAAHFGDPTAEHRALTEGAALVDRSHLDRLEMTGEDRLRFLNGQTTCDLQNLEPGSLVYGFFTSRQGKVQADVTVLVCEDRLWLVLPPGRGDDIRGHLQKYILADRVAVEPLTAEVPLAVVGPRAVEMLDSLGVAGLPAEEGRHGAVDVFEVPARAVLQPVHTLPAVTLWLPAGRLAEVAGRLHEEGAAHGLAPAGWEPLEIARVERGAPRFGADFGPDHFPQETGLEHAVSYTKGCYLGQEVVARIHYRGGVNRHLRALVFDGLPGDEPPAHGTALLADGRPAGEVGTAVLSPAREAVIGLAILHKRAEPGTRVEVEGGGEAEVNELPFTGRP